LPLLQLIRGISAFHSDLLSHDDGEKILFRRAGAVGSFERGESILNKTVAADAHNAVGLEEDNPSDKFVFSAKGAVSMSAWSNGPGIE
jgi:hypothetical protein